MAIGRVRRLAVAVGLVAAVTAGAGSPGGPVEAGDVANSATIAVFVTGANAVAVAAAVQPTTTGSLVCTPALGVTSSPFSAQQNFSCGNGGSSETIGISGVPANAVVAVACNPNTGQPNEINLTIGSASCSIFVNIPTLLVDKVVVGGQLTSSDFTIEVYDDQGALVTTTNDPDPATCPGLGADFADCSIVALDAGSYQLGEAAAYGYAVDNVGCIPFQLSNDNERFGAGIGEFSIGNAQEPVVEYCEITNRYYEGNLIVEKVVVNDDAGASIAADFTAEVYEEVGGALAISQQCIADGSCIDTDLGIGTYRIGETGPAGYTATVTCVETQEPDGPPPTGTTPPENSVLVNESLPGDGALAEILPFNQVTCTITNNDVPTTTTTVATTTTATTTTTTTTVAPTTTALGAGAATLPATGTSATTNPLIAIVAMLLMASGAAMLLVRRRSV